MAIDVWAAQQFYRYQNDEGVLVLDYQVPTHLVKNGYEIISASGQVIEVVPPYQEYSDQELEEAKQLELQQQEDKLLLKSYSSIEELYNARDRKLEGLQRELDILTANISETNTQLDKERAKAAELQRSGKSLRPAMVEHIDKLIAEVRDGRQLLALRKQEYKEATMRYQHYAERLKILLGIEASE